MNRGLFYNFNQYYRTYTHTHKPIQAKYLIRLNFSTFFFLSKRKKKSCIIYVFIVKRHLLNYKRFIARERERFKFHLFIVLTFDSLSGTIEQHVTWRVFVCMGFIFFSRFLYLFCRLDVFSFSCKTFDDFLFYICVCVQF